MLSLLCDRLDATTERSWGSSLAEEIPETSQRVRIGPVVKIENSNRRPHGTAGSNRIPLQLALTLPFSGALSAFFCVSLVLDAWSHVGVFRRLAGEISEGGHDDRGSDRRSPPSEAVASAAIEAALLLQVGKSHNPGNQQAPLFQARLKEDTHSTFNIRD